jgi:large subunit ribosomal protein L24
MKIRKGDRVQVLAGKDGLNIAKKHQKPTRSTMQGGIIDKEMPMPVSNVAIVCPSCGKPTRVGYRFEPDGTKVRICRKCEGDIA